MYLPPPCDNIQFELSGSYSPPAPCTPLVWDFGGSAPAEIVSDTVLINLLSEGAGIFQGNFINSTDTVVDNILTDSKWDILALIDSENCELKTVIELNKLSKQEPHHLPTSTRGTWRSSWTPFSSVSKPYTAGWEKPKQVNYTQQINYTSNQPVEYVMSTGWISLFGWSKSYSIDYTYTIPIDKPYRDVWLSLPSINRTYGIKYGGFDKEDHTVQVTWLSPVNKDKPYNIVYADNKPNQLSMNVLWYVPGVKDIHHNYSWGNQVYFDPLGERTYIPPRCFIQFKFPAKYPLMAGVCKDLHFDMSCYSSDPKCYVYDFHSGARDNYIFPDIDPDEKPPIEVKDSYYKMNTILIQTHITKEPIHSQQVDIKIDKQSWLWQFNITIGDEASLELIKPKVVQDSNTQIYIDIDIQINNWIWHCRVESWVEDKVLGKKVWRVTGRSPSMELSLPQCPKITHTYDVAGIDASGQKVMSDILDGTIFGITHGAPPWYPSFTEHYTDTESEIAQYNGFDPNVAAQWKFPAKSFSQHDATKIEMAKTLASTIGAYLQTTPDCLDNKALIVVPEYATPPWHWKQGDSLLPKVDHEVQAALVRSIGRSSASHNTFTACYVHGSMAGSGTVYFSKVKREGVAEVYGSNITNEYIYTREVAGELGRMALCKTGEWLNHTLRIFSLANKLDPQDLIGLITPGKFIKVVDTDRTFYSRTTACTITAKLIHDASCYVYQTVETEEYIGA